jgi:hypothetical protein
MKIAPKVQKNICIKHLFLAVPKYIRIVGLKTPYLSGLPPDIRRRITAEGAVNMAEFPQLDGVQL